VTAIPEDALGGRGIPIGPHFPSRDRYSHAERPQPAKFKPLQAQRIPPSAAFRVTAIPVDPDLGDRIGGMLPGS